jgi:hypothetical protein
MLVRFVPLDHTIPHFNGATHGVDHAAELDDRAVAGALDDSSIMHRNRWVDEVTAERPEPREDAILVRARMTCLLEELLKKRDCSSCPTALLIGLPTSPLVLAAVYGPPVEGLDPQRGRARTKRMEPHRKLRMYAITSSVSVSVSVRLGIVGWGSSRTR